MKPVAFPEANRTLLGEGEIGDLFVLATGTEIISCWQMTWRERLAALLRGRVYLRVLSPRSHAPVSLSIEAPEAIRADRARPRRSVREIETELEVLRRIRDNSAGTMRGNERLN